MSDSNRLTELLLRWEDLRAQGQLLTAEELCRDCPDQVPAVAGRLAALEAVYRALDTATEAPTKPQLARPAVPAGDAALPCVPGYEILGVLGRGGMGVVYLARQILLNRSVALKMILAGAHAGPEASVRFLREAETIARLKHPNVVQIYEFGAHEGKPFFSLEYLEGGSLAGKLGGEPQPPAQAAQTVEILARAVQAAHEQGIVHRDLKPANVLLAADGTPKITDFGLAKQADSGMTATGEVMGTPSYMAPEQAAGKAREIGPAADIYSLGAILYELLTGRPPFKGATPWDTVQMVIDTEPVPPSRLQARLPRDLETICLKCLDKQPSRRYASAGALAEDLQRFRGGQPIWARRVGVAERTWRWCRRNPAIAGLSAAALLLLIGGFLGMTGLYWQALEQRELADTQRQRAENERRRADVERDLAKGYAREAHKQQQAAETQAAAARAQANRSRQVTQFLVGMFQAADPLGLNGFTFGLVDQTGEKLTARKLLERGLTRITQENQIMPQVRADLLDTIGNVYRSMGRHRDAKILLKKALQIRQKWNAPPAELAASLHSLAWLNHERGNYPTALKLYRDALRLRQQAQPQDEAAIANSQMNLAWLLTEIDQFAEAETLLQDVIQRRQKYFGPNHRETALARGGLAALYLETGRFLEAIPLIVEMRQALSKLEGDRNIWTAADLFQRGVLQGWRGDYAGAQKSLRRSLELTRQALGRRHLYATMPLVQLAITLEHLQKDDEAAQLYQEALDIARERVGLAHPKVLIIVQGLARLLRKKGDRDGADRLFRELRAAHEERFGRHHPFVADILCEYADHLFDCKEFAQQEELLQAAARIYRAAADLPRRRFPGCLTCLAATRYRAGKYAESEPYYREALTVLRQRHRKATPELAAGLIDLARAVIRQGKPTGEAKGLLTEAEGVLAKLSKAQANTFRRDLVLLRGHLRKLEEVAGQRRKG